METRNNSAKQPDKGDRRKALNRRRDEDRRKSADRRGSQDRRLGWGKVENHLLRGALAATASIVFQFSRPFTIIFGYVDLLLASSKEEHTKEKLIIIKEQLNIISEILDNFREVDNFKTIDFDGVDILDTKKMLDGEPNEFDRKIL
ncbi:MAG: hypothetical protein WBG28_10490 [Desulfobulbales bacterium]|jgi:hypothetical protein|nr:hypothetical protein [Desulfobulbaceae bacterium]MDH3541402.1 hypothetical protein [Desulfobulbaceae bacterium]MDH3782138.1 hypothetical protein [Desulfobulbaceae bacterium]MDH3867164.1 hypothetical protein [Desulfobulbaceae bacterium]HKJ14403.1 hypothetical protein [Desulfobulbales bacterium]